LLLILFWCDLRTSSSATALLPFACNQGLG
jgi:hypothetical protein